MIKYKCDYMRYIKHMKAKDYAFIDPPWKLNDAPPRATKQLKYTLWKSNYEGLCGILNNIKVDYIFLWTLNALLEDVFEILIEYRNDNRYEDYFKYKNMITWAKLTKNRKINFGTGHWVRNSEEQLLILARKSAKPFRLNMRNFQLLLKSKERTIKPKTLEWEIMSNMDSKGCDRGCYLFSGPKELYMESSCNFRDFNVDLVDIV